MLTLIMGISSRFRSLTMTTMNATDVPVDDVNSMTAAEIMETIFLGGVCLFGTIGNLLVLAAVATTRSLQVRQNVFIIVLAVVDLITAAFLAPFFMLCLVRGGWPYEDAMCVGIGFLTILCLMTSGLTVNCIAFGRYLTIAHTNPVQRNRVQAKFIGLASGLLIAMCFIAVLFPVFDLGKVGYNAKLGHCSLDYMNQTQWFYCAFMLLIGLVCTLTVVPLSYGLIFWILRKSRISIENMTLSGRANRPGTALSTTREKPSQNSNNSNQERKMLSADEMRLTKKLLLLFLIFFCCWMPYTAVVLSDKDLTVPQEWHRTTNILLWINSALNAYLYAWMIPSYQQAYKRLILKMIRREGSLFV